MLLLKNYEAITKFKTENLYLYKKDEAETIFTSENHFFL